MKRFSIIVLALLLVAVFILPASASATTNPGIKPGSFFYFFDITFEKIGLFFTFNPEKKVEKALAYADERLAEVEALTKEKNSNAIKTAIAGYEKDIALAAEASKKIKDEALTENTLILIAGNASRHQAVLSDVLNNVPEEAKAAVEKASEVSRDQHVQALEFILERKQNAKEQQKEEVAKITSQTGTQNQEQDDKKKNEESHNQGKVEHRAELAAPTPNVAAKIKQENNSEKQNKERTEIENLKREIEDLKKKQTAQPAPVATPSRSDTPKTSSLSNGAIVETDEKGNIVRYIKQPDPQPISNTPPVATPQPSIAPAPSPENQLVKVERCKAEKELNYNKMMEVAKQIVDIEARKFQDDLIGQLSQQVPPGSVPASAFADVIQAQVQISHTKNLETAREQTETYVNEKYLECLNK